MREFQKFYNLWEFVGKWQYVLIFKKKLLINYKINRAANFG